MIGTISLLLLALRRGCEHRIEPVLEFLDTRFAPGYRALLISKKLGQNLDVVRKEFRNPACHGTRIFGRDPYTQFARRVIANDCFLDWDARGPSPQPPGAELGLLHHHLEQTRLFGRDEHEGLLEAPDSTGSLTMHDALDRLLALRSPRDPRIGLTVSVEHAGIGVPTRDVSPRPPRKDVRFRLGDTIRLRVEADRSCHLALIDVGTTGRVSVLWPNAWRADGWIEGGRTYDLPDVESPEFAYELTGQAGRERILAVGSLEPIRLLPLQPEQDAAFRALVPDEVHRLAKGLASDVEGWTLASCEFDIE
jgi:hypothetical protein